MKNRHIGGFFDCFYCGNCYLVDNEVNYNEEIESGYNNEYLFLF